MSLDILWRHRNPGEHKKGSTGPVSSVTSDSTTSVRHTFASHLVMKGVDLRAVAKLGGWRDIQMVMRYAHLAPAHLQAAVDRLVERGSQNPKVAAGA